MLNASKQYIYNENNFESNDSEEFVKPRYISKYLWAYLCGATFWEDKYDDIKNLPTLNIYRRQTQKYENLYLDATKENIESDNCKLNYTDKNRKEITERQAETNCAGNKTERQSIGSFFLDAESNDSLSDTVERESLSKNSSRNTFLSVSGINSSNLVVTELRSLSRLKSNQKSSTVHKSNKVIDRPEKQYETDPIILKRRQKQIDYGKSTKEYEAYLKAIPKNKRDPQVHIFTPKKCYKYSRRSWDAQIKIWRKKLHEWDPN